MTLVLYSHPFSSYCQKVLTALYELGAPFETRLLEPSHPQHMEQLKAVWPFGRFPVLIDGGRPVREASIIVEHLDIHHPGVEPLIPRDPDAALQVRFMDRVFDNDISTPQQKIVFDALKDESRRDPDGVRQAREHLETAYAWLDVELRGREWATGDRFTLADCGAGPFLFYAQWTHAIDPRFETLLAYRRRLMARPSFARCLEEARPYRHYFPLGEIGEE